MRATGVGSLFDLNSFWFDLFLVIFRLKPIHGKSRKRTKMRLKPMIVFILIWAVNETTANKNGNMTVFKGLIEEKELAVELHSRRKRYIVFPKGSSLQLLLEVLSHVPTSYQVFIGPTLQIAWPLPSESPNGFRSERSPLHKGLHFNDFLTLSNTSAEQESRRKIGKYKIFDDLATLMDVFGMTVGLAWQLPDDPVIYSDLKKKHKIYKRNVFKKMETFLQPGGANGRQCVLKALCESGQRTPSKKEFLTEILHKIFSVDEEEEEDLEESHEDKLYRKAHRSTNQNCETLYPQCQFSVFREIQ